MREFNEQRPYDLIILQYGLNVATERGRNYDKYIAGMQTTVQHLKEAFPQAAILIVSVGDRDYKTEEGEPAYHAWHQESGSLSTEFGGG